MKIFCIAKNSESGWLKNLILKMELTILLIFFFLIQASASIYSQTAKFTFKADNKQIVDVLKEIEDNSDFRFLYLPEQVDVGIRVSITANDATVEQILDELFKENGINYEFRNDFLIELSKEGDKLSDSGASNFGNFQQRTVTGKVTDTSGQPLPGVSIIIKGTTQGTVTDVNGEFSLSGITETSTLVFSFIGMTSKEIPAGNQTNINVTLESEVIGIEEVVAIGYGTRTKALNTSSISSLREDDLELRSSTKHLGELLQGKTSGVMVRNAGGAPDAEPVIRIRGMNSILGNNSALIVIDGLQHGSLRNLNPQDIQSMDILKGANATSIYGSEGANGVIVITTKQGAADRKPVITVSSDFIMSEMAKQLPKISAADWCRRVNAIEMASNLYMDPVPIFTESEIAEYEKTGGYDWQNIVTRTAYSQNYNVAIDGGLGLTNYRVSGSFLDRTGIVVNSAYDRYTIQAKINTEITDWLAAGVNWNGGVQTANVVNTDRQTDNAIHGALGVPPIFPVYNDEGKYYGLGDASQTKWARYAPSFSLGNPLASAEEVDIINKRTNNDILGYLLFNPLEGLSLRMEFGVRQNHSRVQTFYNNNSYEGNSVNGIGRVNESSSNYFQNSNILNYDRSFGNHNLNVSGIIEQKSDNYFSTYINNENFPVHSTSFYNLGSAGIQRSSSGHSESYILSYVGRFSYNYDRRYLLSASYRADGSSVFGEKNKWSYFPSGSIGWKASEEDFIASLGVFQNLMLRASYGWTGNQAISPYQSLANIGVTGEYPYYGGSSTILNYGITRAANPNLRWETTEQRDFGIDIAIFDGSLELSADYYYKVTRDLLQSREIASYSGLTSITDNIGKLSNEGYEFSIDHSYVKGDFNMHNGFNISTNKTIIIDLGPVDRLGYSAGGSGASVNDPLIFLFEGERWGKIYGWGYEGTWKMEEEEQAKQFGQLPGDSKYTDLNNDGVIDSEDRMFLGNVIPDFEYGFNSRFSYKNFGLSFQIQGVYGNKIFNVTRSNMLYADTWRDRWTPDNQDTKVPAVGYWDAKTREEKLEDYPSKISFPSAMTQAHSRWVEDGSYIRLKNLTLTYNIPANLIRNIGFQNLTIYVSGKNLITLTKFSGFNPEVSSYTNDKALGTSFHDYPISKEFNVGLNFTL